MKFSQLTSNMRSMIAALAASSNLTTDQLGRACSPHINAQQASSTLLELRKHGLAYSMQKPTGTTYASWAITSVGMAVFEGRPDGDVRASELPQVGQAQCTNAAAPATKRYMVSETGGVGTFMTGDRADVLAEAQRRATAKPGAEYNVYERIAVAHMPVPQAQITLL